MSFVLQAPHELVQTTSLLPSPEFGDAEELIASVNLKRSMNGTVRTYVKSCPDSKLTYEFVLTRGKTLEVLEFINVYYPYNIRVTNHKGEIWICKILNDPMDVTMFRHLEDATFRLELRGRKYNG